MFNLGIGPENFNPRVLFVFKNKYNDSNKMSYHQHDFTTLIYVLSGVCTYNIDDTLYQVKKGSIIVCNPGVYHCKILSPGQEIVEFHAGFNNISLDGLPKNHLIPDGIPPIINLLKYEQDFFKCCNEILVEQEKSEPGRGLMLKALVMKLLVILLKEIYSGDNEQESSLVNFESNDRVNIVNTIISFINENYMKNISLDKISKNMYLSPVYISKVFKEEMGESPINYLIKVRLSKAFEMLEDSSLPIKTIAKNVGYDDAYYFSKLFKKYYGFPPSSHKSHKQSL